MARVLEWKSDNLAFWLCNPYRMLSPSECYSPHLQNQWGQIFYHFYAVSPCYYKYMKYCFRDKTLLLEPKCNLEWMVQIIFRSYVLLKKWQETQDCEPPQWNNGDGLKLPLCFGWNQETYEEMNVITYGFFFPLGIWNCRRKRRKRHLWFART